MTSQTEKQIAGVGERIKTRTRRLLRDRADQLLAPLDQAMRNLPDECTTQICGEYNYAQVRNALVDVLVTNWFPRAADKAIEAFIEKVEKAGGS